MKLLSWVFAKTDAEVSRGDPPAPKEARAYPLAPEHTWETDLQACKLENSQTNQLEKSDLQDAETLIFVDADGVINVGVRDVPGQPPLLLCQRNLNRARKQSCNEGPNYIISVAASRDVGHDDGSYSKFATVPDSSDICELFAQRLAGIINLAGPRCKTVLSSSWRKPHHQNRVLALEAAISKYGGKAFKFEGRTRLGADAPEGRIECISDFLRDHTENRKSSEGPLRVLVLEDFAATHPSQWNFANGVNSKDGLEEYWRRSSSQPQNAHVKLIHCYEEFVTDKGVQVQMGSGLTSANVCEAERFLMGKKYCKHCAYRQL